MIMATKPPKPDVAALVAERNWLSEDWSRLRDECEALRENLTAAERERDELREQLQNCRERNSYLRRTAEETAEQMAYAQDKNARLRAENAELKFRLGEVVS